jgi:hypothetical protein
MQSMSPQAARGHWLPAEARGSRLVRPGSVNAARTQVIGR